MRRHRYLQWGFATLLTGLAPVIYSRAARAPEVVPLRLVEQELVETDETERLYSIRFADPEGRRVDAYLREPIAAVDAAGTGAGRKVPAVVLVAGRFTGREAAKVIPGPLESVMLAVEYPQAIPVRVGVWEWIRSLPAIRRSARRMPGILRGAAYHLAERPEVDAARIGLVGVSFGVPFAAAAGNDRVFGAVALHYGGSNLASLFRANLPVENGWVRWVVGGFAGWWFREMDPGRHVAKISPTPLLLINATADDMIPHEAALRLASHALQPYRHVWLPYGHLSSTEVEVIREVADSTFRYFGFRRD